jgi:hypothetical protein
MTDENINPYQQALDNIRYYHVYHIEVKRHEQGIFETIEKCKTKEEAVRKMSNYQKAFLFARVTEIRVYK